MARQQQLLTTLTFTGPKYEDHGLEIDALHELIAYKRLLIETAKELWRRTHPDRERVPRGFEESICLKFYKLEEGSTAVPIMREVEREDDQLPMNVEDEVDRAAATIDAGIEAAGAGQPLPQEFPPNVIPFFDELGKTLEEGHGIRMRSRGRQTAVDYTPEVRERLRHWTDRIYEDTVDLVGEVRAADLDGCRFTLRLDTGEKIAGLFNPDQEALITEALREHATRRLRVTGQAEFLKPGGKLKRIVRVTDLLALQAGDETYDSTVRPIWETVLEMADAIPDEELANVPPDAATNLKHYLYGAPKEEP